MSFHVEDHNGYLGDLASNGGWFSFTKWAGDQGGELRKLAYEGLSEDPAALAEQARELTPDSESDQSVLATLRGLATRASGFVLVTDGLGDEESALIE